jgi:hypothetical protein
MFTQLPHTNININGTLSRDVNDILGYTLHRAFRVNYKGWLTPHRSISEYCVAHGLPMLRSRCAYFHFGEQRHYFRGLIYNWLNNLPSIQQANIVIEAIFPTKETYITWCDGNYGMAKDKKLFQSENYFCMRFDVMPVQLMTELFITPHQLHT